MDFGNSISFAQLPFVELLFRNPKPMNQRTERQIMEVYDSKILVSEENVIFVSIQYRLTSLGFLHFDQSDFGLFAHHQRIRFGQQRGNKSILK